MKRSRLSVLVLLLTRTAAGVELTNVHHDPVIIDPAEGENATLRLHVSAPATVSAYIYDGRNLLIRTLTKGNLAAGDHSFSWDGRDESGRAVPSESYVYVMQATGRDGSTAHWDLTDTTGGERYPPEQTSWNPKEGLVRYRLKGPSRVRIRIGLANDGPLLRTLIDWVPRVAGAHAERWDGRDASGVLELGSHPHLFLNAEAFTLSRNSILVGPPKGTTSFAEGFGDGHPTRSVLHTAPRKMFDYARQPITLRREFSVRLELPLGLSETADGTPIVREPIAIGFSSTDEDLARALNERCEAVFYLDGQFVHENEVAFLPMTWRWDPKGVNEGIHYITANLRGYDGHFGIATVEVYVEPASD